MSEFSYLEKLLDGVEVKWLPLGHIAAIKTGQSVNKNMISKNPGVYPVINSGREPLGFINTWNTDNDPIGITTRGAGVGSVIWQEGKYFRGNLNYSITIDKKSHINIRYMYHALLHMKNDIHELCTFDGIPALNAGSLKKLLIPIPCPNNPEKSLAIQSEIVRILDKFTALTAELTAELTARKKQYNYYRDRLLSFEEGEVEWKTLGEIAAYSKSRISFDKLDENNYVGVDNLLQNRAGKMQSNYVPTSGNLTEFREGDILIGNIRPYLKKIWQADSTGGTNGDVLVIRSCHESILPRYLYQILADENFFEYNMQHAKGAKMPRGNKDAIMKYRLPIPSLNEQTRIVSVLDKFDTLTNSISEGLPREIELRQKQYEYYRDLLFSFPKPETAHNTH
ncbi:restriction endonuclease subunit S [Citrobacter freundii]|uniref:restriction endonuclease subunit S n=1 Tax=Citrobacter freundii TaxID=546 RepID=UPI000B99B9BF|nr:restriction endonuclease subunit S [Citrobacter freundii]OYQ92136.1 restriction endonuclease subunit M [Citrobacter freundii]